MSSSWPSSPFVIDQFAQLVGTTPTGNPEVMEAVLLIDHLVCVSQSRQEADGDPVQSGPIDVAARLALWGCRADRDDVNWAQMVHPGAIVWPVVLTLGALNGSSGSLVLGAARAGYEATLRCAELFVSPDRARFHTTATAGTVGAAAAAAVISGLGPDQIADSLGHAFSVMGGSAGSLHERSGTRQFHRAHAVRTGMAAASEAAHGLRSTREDLTNNWGLLEGIDVAQANELLRTPMHALRTTSVRPFPTSGWNQGAYEAAGSAAAAVPGPIASIRVTVSAPVAAASRSYPNPTDESWVRLEWAAANAIAATCGIAQTAEELVQKVLVVVGQESSAVVSVEGASGSGSAEVSRPLGHPSRPVPANLLGVKWGMTEHDAERLIRNVCDLLGGTSPDDVAQIESAVAQTSRLPTQEAL